MPTLTVGIDSHALAAQLGSTGGFTVNLDGQQPVTGFALSPYPELSYTLTASTFTAADIDRYAAKHHDVLSRPDHYMGAWVDAGIVWLDVSILAPDLPAARTLGKAYHQLAVYDLANSTEVRL